jgi:nitrate/TMAO reductase-like tetraheme cytochrome c subunit
MLKDFLRRISRNAVSLFGVWITSVSAVIFFSLFGMELVGFSGSPYLGIMAFLIVPAFFVAGLLLIPFGVWRAKRKARKAVDAGEVPPSEDFPVLDFNSDKVRKTAMILSVLSVVNLIIIATATYKGVEVMGSTKFCGTACHTVMAPEFTTYQNSPHAKVKCVECHIGSGASWFVKSKLSGSWQLISVAFNLYQRPIPTPVHNLRPARDTCEQCHWPTKFVGDRLKVITRFNEDEENSEVKTALLIHVGGTQGSVSRGIHWHVDRGVKIRYQADEKRQAIGDVELTKPDGTVEVFKAPKPLPEPKNAQAGHEWRSMDCVDCHNRPSHIYRLPEDEVNTSMASGRIDRTLPFIRREAVKALKAPYATREEAALKIRQAITGFYAKDHPEMAKARSATIEDAVKDVIRIYDGNVWPHMKIGWGAYPTNLGHTQVDGCFRCHDDEHKTAGGRKISQDCALCHSVLAQDEKDPKILKDLLNP